LLLPTEQITTPLPDYVVINGKKKNILDPLCIPDADIDFNATPNPHYS